MGSLNTRHLRALALTLIGTLATGTVLSADKGVQASFDKPMAAVHKAAVDALTVIGCTIKKDEPTSVEGKRERKVGVFVGSGGETVTVTLSDAGSGKVSVEVHTARTFVGGAGQKNWDQPVLDEMTKELAAAAPAT